MKNAKHRTMTLYSRPRTVAEGEQWLALVKQEFAAGRIKGKVSRKAEAKLKEAAVALFWEVGQEERAPLALRLQALEDLSMLVSVTKTRLLLEVSRG